MIAVKVKGAQQIASALHGLTFEVEHKIMQAANVASAEPLVHAAHLLAPVGKTGNLADSIGIEKPSHKRVGVAGQINVGPRRGGKYKGYHAHLVEYPKTNRDGSKSVPHPFMRPAFERTKAQMLGAWEKNAGAKITSYLRRTTRTNA